MYLKLTAMKMVYELYYKKTENVRIYQLIKGSNHCQTFLKYMNLIPMYYYRNMTK